MPTFEIFPKFSGSIYRWDRFDEYDLVKTSATQWRLVFDEEDEGPLEADRQPFEIRMTLQGEKITKLEYFDQQGHKLAELRGISFDSDLFEIMKSEDIENADSAFGMMIAGGATFIGGNTSNDRDDHDDITTGTGNDIVTARGGDDYIKDVGGADTYNGGSGFDQVTFDEWFWRSPELARRGVNVDLASGRVVGPDGKVDTFISIEGVRGTFLKDELRGDGAWNFFKGGRGADIIDGRGGGDGIAYDNDFDQGGTRGIIANLKTGVIIDGFGDRDTVISIDYVEGTRKADVFIDNGRDNEFRGGEGRDKMTFSTGDDRARGDEGGDTFIFDGFNIGEDVIEDFNVNEGDKIRLLDAESRDEILDIDFIDGVYVVEMNENNRIIVEGLANNTPVDEWLIYG